MKRSLTLCSQHIGRLIKFHWHIQGKIKVLPTQTDKILQSYGFDVVDVQEYLNPPKEKERILINGVFDRELPLDENHPDYKPEPCYIHGDNNVLLEGLDQAKVLTNTVEFIGLPEKLIEIESKVEVSEDIHNEVKKRVLNSCIFDATQQKLPKIKDPLRPAWNFPRNYGIPSSRKNELLCKNLIMICDQFNKRKNEPIIDNAFFTVPIKAHNKNIQFQMTSELIVATKTKIRPMENQNSTFSHNLPDLYPLDCSIGLKPVNFYSMENIYPISIQSKYPYIQTAFVYYDKYQVKNEFEEPVTEEQFQGRSLVKGFSLAAAEAQSLFGIDILQLPEPVLVPLIHTDGKVFHFTIFQLNTLELDVGSKMKNIFWNSPIIPLYEVCDYKEGRPVLENYNEGIIKKIITFLNIK